MVIDIEAVGAAAAKRADEIDELRHLPFDLADELAATGLCRALAPAEVGGAELPIPELTHLLEDLAYHDGSTGWCGMISSTTSLAGGYLPADHAAAIYGFERSWTGGLAAPMGRARVVDGGLEVTGRWQWGSGSHHCTSLGGGTLVVDADGRPAPRPDGLRAPFVFFTPGDWTLLDTWYVSGLRGSGSTDYEVSTAFVPEGRWFEPGAAPHVDRTLYRFPFFGALAVGVSSVMLGLARRAVDELVTLAATKKPSGSSRTLAERPVVQAQLAEATAAHRAARLLLDEAVGAAWEAAAAGLPDERVRLQLRLAATHAAERSARAVDLCYQAAGGTAVYATSPLQRLFRDVHVATQHAIVAPRTLEVIGRAAMGLETSLEQI